MCKKIGRKGSLVLPTGYKYVLEKGLRIYITIKEILNLVLESLLYTYYKGFCLGYSESTNTLLHYITFY